jgi:hypothetical protein
MNRAVAAAICVLSVFLAGCPREWQFTVTDLSDPAHPILCLSEYSNCRGSGISFSSFIIAEVDESGRYVSSGKLSHPMWLIKPIANVPLKEVKYGQVPEGWKETEAAKPLRLGKFYSANGNHFFRIVEIDGRVRAEVFSHDEFLEKFYK